MSEARREGKGKLPIKGHKISVKLDECSKDALYEVPIHTSQNGCYPKVYKQ